MNFTQTEIPGVFIIETPAYEDGRGAFVKTFHKDSFNQKHLNVTFRECFYSVSKKNVIRGMHFHLPPKDHAKLIYVTHGAILDVVLDLRIGSPAYGKYITAELSQKNHKLIFIPTGCAHGFLSLREGTCTTYLQSGTYSKEHDTGIRYDSFGMDWGVGFPILSQRDQEFVALREFASPFNDRKRR